MWAILEQLEWLVAARRARALWLPLWLNALRLVSLEQSHQLGA